MSLILLIFFPHYRLAWQAALKKTKVKSDLLADSNMLLMEQTGIGGRICRTIYQYVKANNK